MKYTYAYKTSDGIRHVDAMNASSREEVFEELRRKGIKAIKVIAADGSKANGAVKGMRKRSVALVTLGAAILAGSAVYLLSSKQTPFVPIQKDEKNEIVFTSDESRAAFTNLEARASQIVSRHFQTVERLGLDLLTDYPAIEISKDDTVFDLRAKAGYRAIDASRMEVRDLFKSIFEIFPEACGVERDAAQRLYVETMDKLDITERRLVKDEKAVKILIGNRGKWRCREGKIVWTDAALANEFEYFRRDSPIVVETRQRTASNGIESNTIEIHMRH